MNKKELFIEAIRKELYKSKAWVISAFSIINEGHDVWKKDPYYLRLVQTPSGSFYVDKDHKLVLIEGSNAGEAIYKFKEPISLKAGEVVNLKENIETTIGNLFVNVSTLIYAFGDKIPFINGRIDVKKIEAYIVTKLEDTPKPGESRSKDKIYVDEYIKFVDSMQHLTIYSQLCIWAATEKTMTAPPGIEELKKKLLEENKDRLHDPETIAKINKQLIAFDSEYLKGDPGENFLLSSKSREIVRSKLFLMHGAEQGIEGRVGVSLIENSLSQGWDLNNFPLMNDSLRAGSFNRGAQTELGGEATKWLFRASSNALVTKKDCETRLGKKFTVTPENVNKLVGFSVVATEGSVFIETPEEAGIYLGKTLLVRSPMYCKLPLTDFCQTCVGIKLASNPKALSLAVSAYGSAFLSLFMKQMHGKSLSVQKMDYREHIT